jgi:hypothetical protein
MWLMVTAKLPIKNPPPIGSLFWSQPWPDEGKMAQQTQEYAVGLLYDRRRRQSTQITLRLGKFATPEEEAEWCEMQATEPYFFDGPDDRPLGKSHNWALARRIHYQGEDVRVFPNEYSLVSNHNLHAYILGEIGNGVFVEPSHHLVPDDVAGEVLIAGVLDGESRPIYEAALLDGCTHEQAMATAMAQDVTLPDAEFPPFGWYRLGEAYASYFQ